MCGLVGYYDYIGKGYSLPLIKFGPIVDKLSHRGPDASGIFQKGPIGLGHRRLSILDTRSIADQPMFSNDEKISLVYNGEIYNFRELRAELEETGYTFRTTSDTEVLLSAYLEWGTCFLNKLNGIFAFAIWDENQQRLWLVRDHMGVKPLFYAIHNGLIFFASEPSAILSFPGFPSDHDPYGLDSFFSFSYIPAPMTGYKHIKQLHPGEYLVCEKEYISIKRYWDIPITSKKLGCSEDEMVERLDFELTQATKSQMVSDVPLGAFLSSGIDSFAIVRAMKSYSANDIQAYSIGFEKPEYDELDGATLAANALKVNLVSRKIGSSITKMMDYIKPHCLEPFADSSSLPTFQLCKLAAQDVTVALSGDGADELFAGYSVYKANRLADMYRQFPGWVREGIFKPISKVVPDIGGKYTYREKCSRFVFGAESGKYRDHASWRIIFTPEMKKAVYHPDFWENVKDFDPIGLYVEHILYAKSEGCSDLEACLYADQKFYLPNDMLVKVDRMSMANGLEVRVPFLDRAIVNFSWRIPDHMKIRNGKMKYILRKVISDIYPSELCNLPKSGFNVPYDAHLLHPKSSKYCSISSDVEFWSNYHEFLCKYLMHMLPC